MVFPMTMGDDPGPLPQLFLGLTGDHLQSLTLDMRSLLVTVASHENYLIFVFMRFTNRQSYVREQTCLLLSHTKIFHIRTHILFFVYIGAAPPFKVAVFVESKQRKSSSNVPRNFTKRKSSPSSSRCSTPVPSSPAPMPSRLPRRERHGRLSVTKPSWLDTWRHFIHSPSSSYSTNVLLPRGPLINDVTVAYRK